MVIWNVFLNGPPMIFLWQEVIQSQSKHKLSQCKSILTPIYSQTHLSRVCEKLTSISTYWDGAPSYCRIQHYALRGLRYINMSPGKRNLLCKIQGQLEFVVDIVYIIVAFIYVRYTVAWLWAPIFKGPHRTWEVIFFFVVQMLQRDVYILLLDGNHGYVINPLITEMHLEYP